MLLQWLEELLKLVGVMVGILSYKQFLIFWKTFY